MSSEVGVLDDGEATRAPLTRPSQGGLDRRGRWLLRFHDAGLEQAYQHDDQAGGARRARTASLVASLNWIFVGVVGPPLLGVDPLPTRLLCGAMLAFLLVCAAVVPLTRTPVGRDAIGVGQQVAAAIACLALTLVTDRFDAYAMPAIMLTAAYGFTVTRPALVGSLALAAFYAVAFLVAGIAAGPARDLPLQAFLVTATVTAGAIGAYQLDASTRDAFTQRRVIVALSNRVQTLLHQYLSPSIADTLIDDPALASLGGEVAEVTVLFADLRGYTAFAERASPDEVVRMLNAAFGVTVPIVLAEGGTVVQFMGDALMAVFNAPRRQPDHALRAGRAALAMQGAVAELRASEDRRDGNARPSFRVGVNTGPALVGNIGSAEVRNYSAIGDATNLAARLQTFAEEGSVVIGERTRALIGAAGVVRPLGAPELKGKSIPVAVFELLALDEAHDASA